jgi:hypothetical protein
MLRGFVNSLVINLFCVSLSSHWCLQEIYPSQTRKRGPDPTGTFQSRKSPRCSASTLATHVHFEDSNLSENDDRFEDLEEQDEEEFIDSPIEPSKPKVDSETVSRL